MSEYDNSSKFWRFYLRREGKSYKIEQAAKLPLPPVEKPEKKATPTPPKQDKKKPEPNQQAASTPVEKKNPKRVFNLVDKLK